MRSSTPSSTSRWRRLRLAAVAQRLPTLENRLALLPLLALGRNLGEDALSPAQTSASSPKEEPSAQRSDSGLPVAQNDRRRRWRKTRLRRRKEGQRKKAPSTARYTGIGARSQGSHSAKVVDREGIKVLLDPSSSAGRLPRLSHLWLDAGYTGQDKGAGWVERTLGWRAEIVRHPPKPVLLRR